MLKSLEKLGFEIGEAHVAPQIKEDKSVEDKYFVIEKVFTANPIVHNNSGAFFDLEAIFNFIKNNKFPEGSYLVGTYIPSNSHFDIAWREFGPFIWNGQEVNADEAYILTTNILDNPKVVISSSGRACYFSHDDAFLYAQRNDFKDGTYCVDQLDSSWTNFVTGWERAKHRSSSIDHAWK